MKFHSIFFCYNIFFLIWQFVMSQHNASFPTSYVTSRNSQHHSSPIRQVSLPRYFYFSHSCCFKPKIKTKIECPQCPLSISKICLRMLVISNEKKKSYFWRIWYFWRHLTYLAFLAPFRFFWRIWYFWRHLEFFDVFDIFGAIQIFFDVFGIFSAIQIFFDFFDTFYIHTYKGHEPTTNSSARR